jgi:hypothetical protein
MNVVFLAAFHAAQFRIWHDRSSPFAVAPLQEGVKVRRAADE